MGEASVKQNEVGTIRHTEITMPDGTVFLVDTSNIPDMASTSPIGFFLDLSDALCGASDQPYETMMTMPNGSWANFSKSNFDTEELALRCHTRFVDLILAGRWSECEGNDMAIVGAFDERKES